MTTRKSLKKIKSSSRRFFLKSSFFIVWYAFISFVVVPPIAEYYGRRPLPLYPTDNFPIKPAKAFYFFTNRNYIKPKLLEAVKNVSNQLNRTYPEVTIMYLDGCFPFLNNFPLIPHLSHDDGAKLDLAFIYQKKDNRTYAPKHPSWFGYGFSEQAKPNEYNKVEECTSQGKWQYALTNKLIPKSAYKKYSFAHDANRSLLSKLIDEPAIKKIFIEPHLKARLGYNQVKKVRFAGCHAVRHDDHIHIQL